MVKTIEVLPWHMTLLELFGKNHQYGKVMEELKELNAALLSGDRDLIMEELADVENVLPYLLRFINKKECKIKYSGDEYNFILSHSLLIELILMKLSMKSKYEINKCVGFFLDIVCYSLYNIYAKYNITAEEVDEIIKFKRKRTLCRYFGQ